MVDFWRTGGWNRSVLAVLLLFFAEACAASPEQGAVEAEAERTARPGSSAHRAPAGSASSPPGPGGAESTPAGAATPSSIDAIPVTGGRHEETFVGLSDGRMLAWILLTGGGAGLMVLALLTVVMLEVGPGSVVRRFVGAWRTARQHPLVAAGAAAAFMGLAVAAAYRLPVVPYPQSSALGGELVGLFSGARAAHYRIVCEKAGVAELAAYYADTADYGIPSNVDREYIVRAFGPAGLVAPGLLTAKQAFYIAYYGAVFDASDGGSAEPALAATVGGHSCDSGAEPAEFTFRMLLVNGRRDLALITYGKCGALGALARRLQGGWKIVRMQELLRCTGQG